VFVEAVRLVDRRAAPAVDVPVIRSADELDVAEERHPEQVRITVDTLA
jgi:hypothetical protein